MISAPEVILQSDFETALPQVPESGGVFLVRAGDQSAYMAKTGALRRRLLRILRPPDPAKRSLNLRNVATSVEYWPSGSRFESTLVHFELARRYYPDTYLKLVKLRMPAYVRLGLANEFPRSQVTSRLGSRESLFYGPFRSRASAEQFEAQMLDLFQIRRCQEDLNPKPDHPGCIYGEMNMCLRPCQQAVSVEEYGSEVGRVAEFMKRDGKTLVQTITAARDRLSEEMNFEEAARQHRQLDRIGQMLTLRDELACDIDRLWGVSITPALAADTVKLCFFCGGCWQDAVELPLTSHVSLDQRLRDVVSGLLVKAAGRQERQEHLALLARWFYSSWRDGEWVGFDSLAAVPYKRLVRAISRVYAAQATHAPSS